MRDAIEDLRNKGEKKGREKMYERKKCIRERKRKKKKKDKKRERREGEPRGRERDVGERKGKKKKNIRPFPHNLPKPKLPARPSNPETQWVLSIEVGSWVPILIP